MSTLFAKRKKEVANNFYLEENIIHAILQSSCNTAHISHWLDGLLLMRQVQLGNNDLAVRANTEQKILI